MATRRSHTTELGCIACDDLGDIAAGKEAWLVENPDILCALDTHLLALSNKTLILILRWASTGRGGLVDSPVKFRPDLDGEHITALEWLVFDHIRVLAVGTSSGFLIVYSVDGVLIHKQAIHPGHILKLRVHGRKGDPMQDKVDEVCVVIPGIIARLDGSDIKCMLERLFEGKNSQSWNLKLKNKSSEESENSFEGLPYQVWNINKYGVCADAAITGIMPPPLMELESSQRYYCAVAIGADAVISAFRLSENRSRSVVGAIFSKVVPVTFSTIASFSKMIWRSEPTPSKKPEVKPQPFARASALTCLKDHPRKGEKLTLSPSGTLAAVTDSLGRILLLDTQALVVVRLWKGYRDANCLFMEMLVNRDDTSTLASNNYLKSDYCLCLAIHAPRKGIVEIWQMRTGPRLLTIQCPKGCKILQPACRFGSSLESSSSYAPLEVFLLNGDSGQIFVLNKTLA